MFELRQYTLKPGRRDDLVELFEREFVEGQEVEGMCILGTFRDLDRDDRFVWMRGFRDMDERRRALTAFYAGPVWNANSTEANDTMLDVDDVLLLRPLMPVAYPEQDGERPVLATIAHVRDGDVRDEIADALLAAATVADWSASFVTLSADNTFPALPIREDAEVVVVVTLGRRVDAGDEQLRLGPTSRSRLR